MSAKAKYWLVMTLLLALSLSLYFLFIKVEAARNVLGNIVFALFMIFSVSFTFIKGLNHKTWRVILMIIGGVALILWIYAYFADNLWMSDLMPQLLAASIVGLVMSYIFRRKQA